MPSLVSAANMALKLGEAAVAAAEYEELLRDELLPQRHRPTVEAKLLRASADAKAVAPSTPLSLRAPARPSPLANEAALRQQAVANARREAARAASERVAQGAPSFLERHALRHAAFLSSSGAPPTTARSRCRSPS